MLADNNVVGLTSDTVAGAKTKPRTTFCLHATFAYVHHSAPLLQRCAKHASKINIFEKLIQL